MLQSKLLVKNASVLFFAEIITNLLSLGLIFAIARVLGDNGLGQYSFALAFASLFIIFSEFGTLTFLIKEIAADKSKTQVYLKNLTSMKLVFGILTLLISIIAIIVSGESLEVIYMVIIASFAMFFNYFGYLFRAIFQAHEIMEYDALIKLIEKILSVGLGILVVLLGYGVLEILFTQLFSFGMVFIISWILVSKKITTISLEWDFSLWKKILVSSIPFWLTSIFIYIYFRIDTVMLFFMTNASEVGLYNASYKLIEAMAFIPTIVMITVFPVFSKYYANQNKEHLSLLFQKAFYYLFVLALPILIGGILVSDKIIPLIYGDGFSASIISLQILLSALFFMFINYVMGFYLNATNKAYLFTIVVGIAALFNVVANFIVIPTYGYIGASVTTVITETLNFVLLAFFIFRAGQFLPGLKLLKPIFAVIILGIATFFLSSFNIFILVPIVALLYFLVLFLIGGISKEDQDMLKKVFNRQ